MPKYYVISGTLEKVQDAKNPLDAMVKALTRAYHEDEELTLGVIFSANEIGFEIPCCECFKTQCDECFYMDENGNCTEAECVICSDCIYDEATNEMYYKNTPYIIQRAGLENEFGSDQPMEDVVEKATEDAIKATLRQMIEDEEASGEID